MGNDVILNWLLLQLKLQAAPPTIHVQERKTAGVCER